MAGFSKVYFIGATGGFMGADGLARPFVQIMVGDADRQWLEAVYQDDTMRPMGSITTIIPAWPDDPTALLDAAIVFLTPLFKACPSLASVEAELKGVTMLDFHMGKIPAAWEKLRKEALPVFHQLNVFEAELRSVDVRA